MALSVDGVLEKIGTLGWFQIRMIAMFCFMALFDHGFQVMLPIITAAEPRWRCVANSTVCNLTGEFRPGDKFYDFRCGDHVSRQDWEFTDSFTSIVTEYDLVCGDAIIPSVAKSMVFVGWMFGSISCGVISDKMGRKPVTLILGFLCALFGALSAAPKVVWLFVLLRFVVGFGIGASSISIFVLVTEFGGIRHRHVGGTTLWFSWATSLVSLAGLGYAVRNWKILTLICSVPGILAILLWWFVPESARYLLLKGRKDDAETVLRKVAAVNKKPYPEESLEQPEIQQTGNLLDLFRTKKMVHRTLVNWYAWFVIALVFYAVLFGTPNLAGSLYLNLFLTTIVEFFANGVSIWIMGRFSRKKSVIVGLVVSFLASLGAALLIMHDPGDSKGFYAGILMMIMVAKIFIVISFNSVYVYTTELFPTVIRNVGMGTSTAAARIGSFSAPYVTYLYRYHPLIPYSIIAVNCLLASLACLTLPETARKPTAETLDQENTKDDAGKLLETTSI